MLKTFSDLRGYSIRATDGDLGSVKDVLFLDLSWAIRYAVVDTGHWLPGRRVLLAALVLQQPDLNEPVLHVDLTTERVEHSPDIESDKPVSRQHEEALARHYSWPEYWGERLARGADAALDAAHAADAVPQQESGNPSLRSAVEVSGYHVGAADGEIGHVADVVVDTTDWEIRYLVIDTGTWWPGQKVLVSPHWLLSINWQEQKVHTNLRRQVIKTCPPYSAQELIDRNYEERLHEALGQPKYWASTDTPNQ